MLKTPPVRSEKHRRFIASLPCCMSLLEDQTQAAHIRCGTGGGMGLKPGDDYCVPLSWVYHRRQHEIGEEKFWGPALEAAKQLAKHLYQVSGDYEAGCKLVQQFREGIHAS